MGLKQAPAKQNPSTLEDIYRECFDTNVKLQYIFEALVAIQKLERTQNKLIADQTAGQAAFFTQILGLLSKPNRLLAKQELFFAVPKSE
jgi:hypothetical protein